MHTEYMENHIDEFLLPGETAFTLDMEDDLIRGYFSDSGEGPVGIYLHGFRSHSNGEKSLEIAQHAIAKGRSWLRFDLRGHGKSGGDLQDQTISSGLQDLLAVIDSMTDRPLILHGSSMGAWLCLLAALERRDQVTGLMLIAPAFNFIQHNFARLPGHILEKWRRDTYMSFPDAYSDEPYSVHFGIIKDAQQYDVINNHVQLDIPLHIVHGENDPIVPIAHTEKFIHRSDIPRLVFERIPQGEHRLTEFIPLIISHIDRVWQETRK